MSTWTKGGLRPALLRVLVVTVFVVGAACSSEGGKSVDSRTSRDSSTTTTTTAVVGGLSPTTAASVAALATKPTTLRARWNQAISEIGGGILLKHLEMDPMNVSATGDSAQAELADFVKVDGPLRSNRTFTSVRVTIPQATQAPGGRNAVNRDNLPRLIVAATLPSGPSAVDLETKTIADQIAIANWSATDQRKSVSAEGLEFTVVARGTSVFFFEVRKPS